MNVLRSQNYVDVAVKIAAIAVNGSGNKKAFMVHICIYLIGYKVRDNQKDMNGKNYCSIWHIYSNSMRREMRILQRY